MSAPLRANFPDHPVSALNYRNLDYRNPKNTHSINIINNLLIHALTARLDSAPPFH